MDAVGAVVTGALGRARWTPSMTTFSPSSRPSTMPAVSGVNWPRRTRRQGDVVIIYHIHVAALLIGKDRGSRHGDDLPWLHGFKEDGDELVGRELAKLDTSSCL